MSDPKGITDGKDGKTQISAHIMCAHIVCRLIRFTFGQNNRRCFFMNEDRIAVLGIIISDENGVEKVNAILHEKSSCIRGRMGLPLRDRNINTITIVLDATVNEINSLTGKLGAIPGVSAKAMFR